MKIGEFSKKYGVNASTVRYYIDKTLITPKKENGQYIFDKTCMEQMERIIRYKKYKFSLGDIDLLSFYEGAAGYRNKSVANKILGIFKKKENQLQEEIEELENIKEALQAEMDELACVPEEKSAEPVYIPIEALDILFCPICGRRLKLKSADIEGRGILKGDLGCSCGYFAVISNGMILCEGNTEDSPVNMFDNVNTVESFAEDFNEELRGLIERAQLWVYQKITAKKKVFKYALIGPFFHNFLIRHIKTMMGDTIYIITDVSTRKLEKAQQYLHGTEKKFLYIAGNIDKLPIKNESIDLYVDDFSSSNYTFTYNKSIFDAISRLMKPKSLVIGQSLDVTTAKLHGSFSEAGIRVSEENNCGTVTTYSAVKE